MKRNEWVRFAQARLTLAAVSNYDEKAMARLLAQLYDAARNDKRK